MGQKKPQNNTDKVLDSIFGNLDKICRLPVEEQAKYADYVIANAVEKNNLTFLEDQISNIELLNDKRYSEWNSCAIGGVAHIAVHCKDKNIRDRAKDIHQGYMKWHNRYMIIS